jgi:hypothetical protein
VTHAIESALGGQYSSLNLQTCVELVVDENAKIKEIFHHLKLLVADFKMLPQECSVPLRWANHHQFLEVIVVVTACPIKGIIFSLIKPKNSFKAMNKSENIFASEEDQTKDSRVRVNSHD